MTSYPVPRGVTAPCARNPWLHFSEDREAVEAAKNVCGTCPWRDPCAAWAIVHDERGVWGATSDSERANYRRENRIVPQRPPLSDFLRAANAPISHGSEAGIAYHRRMYGPLCQRCRAYEARRKARAS